MKSALVLAIVAATAILPGGPAEAARMDATDLAADCADGVVEVDGQARFVRGSAVIDTVCQIQLGVGERFVLRDVAITGSGGIVVTTAPDEATANSQVRVAGSTIELDGPVELNAGCAAGDAGVPDGNARVVVRNSSVRGDTVQLCASLDWPGGVVRVISSQITATSTTFPFAGVSISASPGGGSNGNARVIGSTLSAATGISIVASPDATTPADAGRVVARNNVFDSAATVTITAGSSGTCRSTGNTPAVACTP